MPIYSSGRDKQSTSLPRQYESSYIRDNAIIRPIAPRPSPSPHHKYPGQEHDADYINPHAYVPERRPRRDTAAAILPSARILPVRSGEGYHRNPIDYTNKMERAQRSYHADDAAASRARTNYKKQFNDRSVSTRDLAGHAAEISHHRNSEVVARDAFQQKYPYSQPSHHGWTKHEAQIDEKRRSALKDYEIRKLHDEGYRTVKERSDARYLGDRGSSGRGRR